MVYIFFFFHKSLYQHQNFLKRGKEDKFLSNYMKWIGHTEFGPHYQFIQSTNLMYIDDIDINHWLEQWYLTYKNCLEIASKVDNFHLICYESLCKTKKVWREIQHLLEIKETYHFDFTESIKDISLNMDSDLLLNCQLIYDKLVNQSI